MTSRLALLVRSDHRGLGYQTLAYWQHLAPAKTLHVRMTSSIGSWTPYTEHDWYGPETRQAAFNGFTGTLDDDALRWLLTDVDVLLTAETAYDHRAWDWARQHGVRTILVGNPEFLGPDKLAGPDLIVLPSTWRMGDFPDAIHLPQPVDQGVFPYAARPFDPNRLRFLHIVGHRAIRDRQGTDVVLDCLRFLRHPIDLTIRCQGALSAPQELLLRGLRQHQKPTVLRGDVDEPGPLYDGYDVLLAPRRYGGLSLPLNEAASCGMAILAVNREPERAILPPESLIPAHHGREAIFQCGLVPLDDANPAELAAAIDHLTEHPEIVARLSGASDAYARGISWDVLGPEWKALIERVADMQGVTA